MPISKNISIDHILKAIDYLNKNEMTETRLFTKYVLVYNDEYYPPAHVLSIANTFVNNMPLESNEFFDGDEVNRLLKSIGFMIIEKLIDNEVIDLENSFHKRVLKAYDTAKTECGYNAKVFIQMVSKRGAVSVAREFLARDTVTKGFDRLWSEKRLDLTIEASVLLPQYKDLFTLEERRVAFERLKEFGYVVQGVVFEDEIQSKLMDSLFIVGENYSRKDVYRILNVPDAQQGGNWDTGYTRYNNDFFVFANVGTAGRTGHDHPNRFDGNDLVWYGKNGSKSSHDSIQALMNPNSNVYIFARENSKDTQFFFIGNGKVKSFKDTSPVHIVWRFNDPLENHPEIIPEEENEPDLLIEGSVKQVFVNVYERNPIARQKCIDYYGCECIVCSFNFHEYYGEIGKDFIHVHHLNPLYEIGNEYEIDAIRDLRPVCPNCHAMLHKRKPAYSITELKALIILKS